jgi:hypothetical protein
LETSWGGVPLWPAAVFAEVFGLTVGPLLLPGIPCTPAPELGVAGDGDGPVVCADAETTITKTAAWIKDSLAMARLLAFQAQNVH